MKWFLILILSVVSALGATTYTEFYCDASASANNTNVNAGSTTGGPVYGPSVNGNWDGTSVFTPTDGSTPASTVSAGMWMSVYYDNSTNLVQAGTMGGAIFMVTNVAAGANGAITVDRATISGTAPTSSATGRTVRVGGCWKGPYGTIGFPFGFIATNSVTTNSAAAACQFYPRCNLKNSATYAITAAMAHSLGGPCRFQGYGTSPGDGGRATIDGGAPGTSYALLTLSGNNIDVGDIIFANNGTGGSAVGVSVAATESLFFRCVAHNTARSGFSLTAVSTMTECEAYACNTVGTAGHGGFICNSANMMLIRCISHDNAGANTSGFVLAGTEFLYHCIADTNGKDGYTVSSTASLIMESCDAYNNGGAGIDFSGNSGPMSAIIENCNLVKNGTYGIGSSGNSLHNGMIANCGFGSGTQANSTAALGPTLGGIDVIGSVTYGADLTPWVDPVNGDFRINLTAAKAAGRGAFTETQASYTGTVGYPDIGAAQSPSTNAAVSGGSWTFSQ